MPALGYLFSHNEIKFSPNLNVGFIRLGMGQIADGIRKVIAQLDVLAISEIKLCFWQGLAMTLLAEHPQLGRDLLNEPPSRFLKNLTDRGFDEAVAQDAISEFRSELKEALES